MRKLNREGYRELREESYKSVGIVGNAAERFQDTQLEIAYIRMSQGLDAIDQLGYDLGYLDSDTNEETEPTETVGPEGQEEME